MTSTEAPEMAEDLILADSRNDAKLQLSATRDDDDNDENNEVPRSSSLLDKCIQHQCLVLSECLRSPRPQLFPFKIFFSVTLLLYGVCQKWDHCAFSRMSRKLRASAPVYTKHVLLTQGLIILFYTVAPFGKT